MSTLAELEIYHSRPIAPTRRVALGHSNLPVVPSPGFGGILLGGIVAAHGREIDPDLSGELARFMTDIADGRRIAQPKLRYRFQTDRVGLVRSRFRLVGKAGGGLGFELEERCTPTQAVLGALYATARFDLPSRLGVMATLRRALRWRGGLDDELVRSLVDGFTLGGVPAAKLDDPRAWALTILGLTDDPTNRPSEVRGRFRSLLRQVHPDHGGASEAAALRIAELTEAKRILLATAS